MCIDSRRSSLYAWLLLCIIAYSYLSQTTYDAEPEHDYHRHLLPTAKEDKEQRSRRECVKMGSH